MNITGSTNLTVISGSNITQEIFDNNVYNWLTLSATVLPFYVALLKLSQEIDYLWSKSFSLPTLLYILARYGGLVEGGFLMLLALASSESCNTIANVTNYVSLLPRIGVQGLLIARAYALCQKKFFTNALAFCFLASMVLSLWGIIATPGCFEIQPLRSIILEFANNAFTILDDILVFGICTWRVWGTWKLKREAGIRSAHSLVSELLSQTILRFCFVVVISITNNALIRLDSVLSNCLVTYQNALSSIIIADSFLDLRSLNSAKIEANHVSLPPIQLSNVLQHIHQSFIVELSTPEDIIVQRNVNNDNLGSDFMGESEVQPV